MSNNQIVLSLPGYSPESPATVISLNLGATPDVIAQNAYAFSSANFALDEQFLQSSVSGTQQFLANQIAPVLSSAENQINANAQQLPGIYSGLENVATQSMALMSHAIDQGINAVTRITNASIAASRAAASGGGGCYITTAVCDSLFMADNCALLNSFRTFRDIYMWPYYPDEVHEYYLTAPEIVAKIDSLIFSRYIYAAILRDYLLPAHYFIVHGQYLIARLIYRGMVRELQDKYK